MSEESPNVSQGDVAATPESPEVHESPPERRNLVADAAMAGSMLLGYGTFAWFAGKFLYPAKDTPTSWMYVRELNRFEEGESLRFRTPGGEQISIARLGSNGDVSDFVALSSVCPHLGCKVHWQPQRNRFFCPCHNGVFSSTGKALEGPPAEAGQSLKRYPLKIVSGLLYIEVATDKVAKAELTPEADDGYTPGEGHDPCLAPRSENG